MSADLRSGEKEATLALYATRSAAARRGLPGNARWRGASAERARPLLPSFIDAGILGVNSMLTHAAVSSMSPTARSPGCPRDPKARGCRETSGGKGRPSSTYVRSTPPPTRQASEHHLPALFLRAGCRSRPAAPAYGESDLNTASASRAIRCMLTLPCHPPAPLGF